MGAAKTLRPLSYALILLAAMSAAGQPPAAAEREQIRAGLTQLAKAIDDLKHRGVDQARLADIEIYHKAATWILRFEDEFYTPAYVTNTLQALDHGLARAADSKFTWESR